MLLNTGIGEITTYEKAEHLAAEGWGEELVIGRPAIDNPNLVRRWRDLLLMNERHAAIFTPKTPKATRITNSGRTDNSS